MSMNIILDNYTNDGYLYCIKTNLDGKDIVKIGKTGMKMKDSEDHVITKLHRRYNTYYPSYEMLYLIRVNNHNEAERKLFSMLSHLRLDEKHEIFYYEQMEIDRVFGIIKAMYPCIDSLIKELNVDDLTVLNNIIRERECEL